jgi:hypothetical protein
MQRLGMNVLRVLMVRYVSKRVFICVKPNWDFFTISLSWPVVTEVAPI